MFKHFVTLIRGAHHRAEENFTDAHALLILEQQMRDGANAVTATRKAVAVAMAQAKQEREQHKRLKSRIADLETRATEALKQKKAALAREAAETIAVLEDESATSADALARFDKEIIRLKDCVRKSEAKLRELQRGQRLATATDRAQKMRNSVTLDGVSTLADAESTLEQLRTRQNRIDLTNSALDDLDPGRSSARLTERLAEAGCGEPLNSSADDVLERLTRKMKS